MKRGIEKILIFSLLSLVIIISGCSFWGAASFFCKYAGSDKNVDHCNQWAAVQGSDEDTCAKIEGKGFEYSNPPRDKCYLRIAEKEEETSYCNKIEGGMMSYTKEECYEGVATKSGDPDKCVGLSMTNEIECRTKVAYDHKGADGKPLCGAGYVFDSITMSCRVMTSSEKEAVQEDEEKPAEDPKEDTSKTGTGKEAAETEKEAEPVKPAAKAEPKEEVPKEEPVKEPAKEETKTTTSKDNAAETAKEPDTKTSEPEKKEEPAKEEKEGMTAEEALDKIKDIKETAEETKESVENILDSIKDDPPEKKLMTVLDELSNLKSKLMQEEMNLESKVEKETDKTKKAAYMLELEKIRTEQKAFNEDLDKETNSWWSDKIKGLFGGEEEKSEEEQQQENYDNAMKKLEAIKKGIDEIEDMKKKGIYDKLAGEPLKAFVIIENGIEYVKYVPLAGEVAEKIYGKSVGAFALKAKKVAVVSTKARDCEDASRVLDDDCLDFANGGGRGMGWR